MEFRPGRSASRYGSVPQPEPPHPPLMNGPVRKWRKQWVNCGGGGDRNTRATTTPLRLCKWIALSDEDAAAEETPKRRYRYYPIVALKNTNTGTPEKVSNKAEASIKNLSNGSPKMSKAVDDASQKLSNEEIPFQKPSEDESDVNKSQGNGSYSGSSGTNNCTWTNRMMIDWEEELMSSN